MTLTRQDVNSLYLICLGRMVENDQACEARATQSAEECACDLLCSHEFDLLVLQPTLSGQDLPHSKLPSTALIEATNFIEDNAFIFQSSVPSNNSWYALIADIVAHPVVREKFCLQHSNGKLFIDLINIRRLQDKVFQFEIEELTTAQCRGYIIDIRDPNRDLTLKLRLNGTTVALIPALGFRRIVQDKYGGTGRVGFEIEFEDFSAFTGLSSGTIDLIESVSGHALVHGHKLAFSKGNLLETRDYLIDTLFNLRGLVDDLIEKLDGRSVRDHFSLSGYGNARLFARHVRAPSTETRLAVLIDASEKSLTEAVARALVDQSKAPVSVHVIGGRERIDLAARTVFEKTTIPLCVHEIPGGLHDAARRSEADWVVMLSPAERLEPDALAWLAYAAERPGTKAAYADSEQWNPDPLALPRLKPVFRSALDPDLLFTSDEYDGPLCVPTEALIDDFDKFEIKDARLAILLRFLESDGRTCFRHVPLILSRSIAFDVPQVAATRRLELVAAHLHKIDPSIRITPYDDMVTGPILDRSRVRWPGDTKVGISVIIPTRDSIDMVLSLISSLKEHTAFLSLLRIYVVSNNSSAPQTSRALEAIRDDELITVVERKGSFNWAALNDFVIQEYNIDGIVLCLNNDMICKTTGWDDLLRGQLARPDVDIVGGRLLYANGMLQHAGVAMVGVWLHEGMGDSPDHGLYRDRTRVAHECSAVTGAFMAFTRELYEDVGGFDIVDFPISYNDVEFCVRAERRGARILYDPEQVWIHFESETRGFDAHDPEKQDRDNRSREKALQRLPRSDYLDLSINPHILRHTRPFSVMNWPQRDEVMSWIDQQADRHSDA